MFHMKHEKRNLILFHMKQKKAKNELFHVKHKIRCIKTNY